MKTDAKAREKDLRKDSPVPATQKPGIKAVYDSTSRKLHGAHGIGCRN